MRFRTPTAPDHEPQLLARIRTGDEKDASHAFTEICSCYECLVKQTAWSILRNAHEADDVTQNVWLEWWANRRTVIVHTSVRAYLFDMAKNRALNWRRGENRRHHLARTVVDWQRAERHDVVENDAVYTIPANERLQQIAAIVETLPPRQREVYLLVTQHGYTHAQVATLLKISLKTVSNHMWQINEYIRRQLALREETQAYA